MSVTIKSSPDASHESDCPGRTQSKLPPEVVERVLDLLVIQRHEFKERHECFQLSKRTAGRSCTGGGSSSMHGGPEALLTLLHVSSTANRLRCRPWPDQSRSADED
jgi:hypothetical protein